MTTATRPRCTSGEPQRSSRLSTSGVRKVGQPNWSYRHRQTCPSTNAASARYGSTNQSSVAMTHLPHIRIAAPGRSAARPTALARSVAGYPAAIATRYQDGSRRGLPPGILEERHLTVDRDPDVRHADRRDKQRGDEVANGESHGCHLPSLPPSVRPAPPLTAECPDRAGPTPGYGAGRRGG